MERTTPHPKRSKDGPPPARFTIRDERGVEVGSVWAAGPGVVQWYTHHGGGRAASPNAAFEAVKANLGVS